MYGYNSASVFCGACWVCFVVDLLAAWLESLFPPWPNTAPIIIKITIRLRHPIQPVFFLFDFLSSGGSTGGSILKDFVP